MEKERKPAKKPRLSTLENPKNTKKTTGGKANSRSGTKQGDSTEDEGQQKFPHKLMQLLNDEVAPESLWWLPGGKSFAIEQKTFPTEVLDKYLQGAKLQSFVRRLHKWGFHRETRSLRKVMGPTLSKTVVSFCHELFQKDQPHLMDQMKEIASSKARIGSSEAKEAPEMDFLRTADYRNSGGSASSLYSDILSQSGSSQHLLTALNRNYAPSHSSEGLLPQQLQQRQQQQRSLRDLGGPHSLPQNFQRNSLLSNLERENTLLQALRQQQQNERLLQQRIDDMARQNALAQLQQQLQQLQQRDWESTAARLSRLAGTGNDLSTSDRARLEALLVENQQRQGSSVLFPNSAPSSSGQLSTEDLSSLLGSQLPTGANDGTNNQTTSSRDSELLNALMIREFLQRRQSQQRNDHGSNSGNANTF